MKQSLQLRLGQQLTMTPQLQQAIRLLQLSTLDLQTEIQQVLDSNLMLEQAEDGNWETGEGDSDSEREARDSKLESGNEASQEAAEPREPSSSEDNIPDDLPVDSQWDDIYDGSTSYSAPDPDQQRDMMENQSGGGETLREHLRWQANLSHFTERDETIAEVIIDLVGDDGYLVGSMDDMLQALPPEWEVEEDEVEAVRRRIQQFDPVGVASFGAAEALLVQLNQLAADTPWRQEARELVSKHLDLLVNRQYPQLGRKMKLSRDELQEVLALVQTLHPRPGAMISNRQPEYVIPDVFVRKIHGVWRAELNPDVTPKLRVNNYYASLVKRGDSSADNTTMRNHLQEARWFIKSLQSRNETLLKVANCIVDRQRDFFEHGEEAMKPLVLREVAETVDMHESTISRITTQKYMYTPRGTFEFKYFFSSHVSTVDGGEASATAIRARIKRLVADENPAKPLSDSKLADILRDEGIDVARRTVAKYREAMGIASSTERKRLG